MFSLVLTRLHSEFCNVEFPISVDLFIYLFLFLFIIIFYLFIFFAGYSVHLHVLGVKKHLCKTLQLLLLSSSRALGSMGLLCMYI